MCWSLPSPRTARAAASRAAAAPASRSCAAGSRRRTTSAVRSCLILSIVRAFSAGTARPAAWRPRRRARRPRTGRTTSSASAGSVVVRVRWHGPSSPASASSRAGAALAERPVDVRLVAERQQVEGDERRPASSPPACRPASRPGGSAPGASRTRAGRPIVARATKSSPSSTHRSGSCSRIAATTSGK